MVEEKMLIIGELIQGKEQAIQLNKLDPLQSREACLDLVEKIVSTYDKALSILNILKRGAPAIAADLVETFHQSSGGHTNSLTNNPKKRKTVARWNEQMRVVCSDDKGGESTKDDGQYRWRKYGQKHILRAKFPRAYYRCTHRSSQGCLATKKVQRSDNNSSNFHISYKGRHTCVPIHSTSSSPNIQTRSHNVLQPPPLFNLQQGQSIINSSNEEEEDIFNSISINPFTHIESIENVDQIGDDFFSKLLEDDQDHLFLSPTTTASDSDCFPFYMQQLNSYGSLNGESDPDHMILTPTSGSQSSFTGFDVCVDQVEDFDTTRFLNETLGYFT